MYDVEYGFDTLLERVFLILPTYHIHIMEYKGVEIIQIKVIVPQNM